MLYRAQRLYFAITTIKDDGARRLRTLFQRQQADLVSVSKSGFFTADCTHTNALIDVVRTIFNNAVF